MVTKLWQLEPEWWQGNKIYLNLDLWKTEPVDIYKHVHQMYMSFGLCN